MHASLNSFGGKLAQIGLGVGGLTVLTNQTRVFAENEHHLRGIGNAGKISKEELKSMGRELLETGIKTNQFREELVKGIDVMVGSGMELRLAKSLIYDIGNTATATGAQIEDLSKTAFSLSQNLKISPGDMGKTLGILASEGYSGAFELKDMARYFPIITASIQKLKFEGPAAAASIGAFLQVARQDAGTSEEAATNVKDWMSKITSENLVRNFDKNFNIDWEKVFKREILTAEDPILAATSYINKVIGDNPFNLNKLFGNQEAMNAQMAMNHHLEDYKNIRKNGYSESGTVIERSKSAMMDTALKQVDRLKILLEATAQESETLNSIWEKGANILKSANDALEAKRPSAEQLVGGGTAAVVGGYALTRMGGGLLKLLGGGANLAAGVGMGKALQEAAGVTSVFVVNMPGGGLGSGKDGGSPVLDMSKGAFLASMLRFPLAVGAFGVGAWGGDALQKHYGLFEDGTDSGKFMDKSIAKTTAFFGAGWAKDYAEKLSLTDDKNDMRPPGWRKSNLSPQNFNVARSADRLTYGNVGEVLQKSFNASFSDIERTLKDARELGGSDGLSRLTESSVNIEQHLSQMQPQMQAAINASNLAERIGAKLDSVLTKMAEKKADLTIKIDGPGKVTNAVATGFNLNINSGILPVGQ